MSKEREYIATVHFETVSFSVFNCDTQEEAEKSARESAEDLARCMGWGASVQSVEVEEMT